LYIITNKCNILGFEISGIIERIGESVINYKPGDEVIAMIPIDIGGGNAEYIIIGTEYLALKPTIMSHIDAVAILQPGIRAYTALQYHMHITAGESLLIINGSSV